MPVVRILHISDLHSRGPRDRSDKWKRSLLLRAWARDLTDVHDSDHPIDILCFTGDIADFGHAEEYAATTDFLRTTIASLKLSNEQVFVVPGNHDIDRKIQSAAWETIRAVAPAISPHHFSSWIVGGKTPPGLVDNMRAAVLERQSAFWTWIERDLGLSHILPRTSPHGSLGYRSSITLPRRTFPVQIIGFDSAWLAGNDQDAGNLRLTIDQVGRLVHQDDGEALPGLRIALIHHPLNEIADTKDWKQLLSDRIDLLLRGHLHSGAAVEEIEPRRRLRHIASGCLYEGAENIGYPNSFNVIEIETDDDGQPLSIQIRFRRWSPESNHWFDDSGLYRGAKDGRYRWDCREVGEQVDAALEVARKQSSEAAVAILLECWERLEPRMVHRDRVRVLRTLAPAHEACGDGEAASRTYEQVASIARKETDAEAFIALAHLHRSEYAEVVRHSEAVLAINHEHELALVALIHAAAPETPFESLNARVPDSLRENTNVLYALGWRAFLGREFDAASRMAELGIKKEPNTARFVELQAGVALKKIESRQNTGLRVSLTQVEREDLARVETALNSTLTGTISAASRVRVLYYLAEVSWRAGKIPEAVESFVALLALGAPVDLDYVERYLDLLLEERKWSEAERVAAKYAKADPSIRMTLYLARARELREATPSEIAEVCNALRAKLSHEPEDSKYFVEALFWLIRSDASFQPIEVKEVALPRSPVLAMALYSQSLTLHGDKGEALATARTARTLLTPNSSLAELVHVARALAGATPLDAKQEAIDVWVSCLLPKPSPGPWLYQAFELATSVNDERFTRQVYQRLRDADLATPQILEHEVNYLMRTKSYDEALAVIEFGRARHSENGVFIWGLLLRRSVLGVWLRRPDLVERDHRYLIGASDYPLEVARSVHMVLHYLDPLIATDFAYQRMRKDRDNPGILSLFANSVGSDAAHIPNFETVDEGAAVAIETSASGLQWVIVETGGAPSSAHNEYPSEHALVRALHGHRLGDTCQIPGPRGTVPCTIVALTSKYFYARNEIWRRWATTHPGIPYVEQISVPRDANGDLDIPGFFALLDELNAGRPSAEDLLQNPLMCPSVLATVTGTTVLASYAVFLGSPMGVFRQAPSVWKEFESTAALIDASTEFLLDPLTIAVLVDIDAWVKLEPLAERWAVTHATLDEYREVLAKHHEGESATIRRQGAGYEFLRRDPKQMHEARLKVEAALDWLERKCTVLGGSSVLNLPAGLDDDLRRLFPESVIQSMAAAYESGRVLWTDDFAVSVTAEARLPMRRAWTEVCFTRFRALGLVDDEFLTKVKSYLVASGFDSTSIDSQSFLQAAQKAGWNAEKWTKWLRCLRFTRTSAPSLAHASASILNSATVQMSAGREEFVRKFLGTIAQRPDRAFILSEIETLLDVNRFGLNAIGAQIVRRELARLVGRPG